MGGGEGTLRRLVTPLLRVPILPGGAVVAVKPPARVARAYRSTGNRSVGPPSAVRGVVGPKADSPGKSWAG